MLSHLTMNGTEDIEKTPLKKIQTEQKQKTRDEKQKKRGAFNSRICRKMQSTANCLARRGKNAMINT
ncbi:hypothetical protein OUZ56_004853 [Daphnia magna]|uniref:Uncharacterized protein n=1 Tax=Daphnia magna TaxID=35525 RepID=A0ABQ9YR23_9CRUS|nr:hypothetical protein OUZ56_004853 [Daphnia magna]